MKNTKGKGLAVFLKDIFSGLKTSLIDLKAYEESLNSGAQTSPPPPIPRARYGLFKWSDEDVRELVDNRTQANLLYREKNGK